MSLCLIATALPAARAGIDDVDRNQERVVPGHEVQDQAQGLVADSTVDPGELRAARRPRGTRPRSRACGGRALRQVETSPRASRIGFPIWRLMSRARISSASALEVGQGWLECHHTLGERDLDARLAGRRWSSSSSSSLARVIRDELAVTTLSVVGVPEPRSPRATSWVRRGILSRMASGRLTRSVSELTLRSLGLGRRVLGVVRLRRRLSRGRTPWPAEARDCGDEGSSRLSRLRPPGARLPGRRSLASRALRRGS